MTSYRKIPNISPGLIDILSTVFGGLFGRAYIGGGYIRRAFYVSIFVSRLITYIIISMKYPYYWSKQSFFKQNSP